MQIARLLLHAISVGKADEATPSACSESRVPDQGARRRPLSESALAAAPCLVYMPVDLRASLFTPMALRARAHPCHAVLVLYAHVCEFSGKAHGRTCGHGGSDCAAEVQPPKRAKTDAAATERARLFGPSYVHLAATAAARLACAAYNIRHTRTRAAAATRSLQPLNSTLFSVHSEAARCRTGVMW